MSGILALSVREHPDWADRTIRFLASDHVGYSEKYGFSPISDERSRIFRVETISTENGSAIHEM